MINSNIITIGDEILSGHIIDTNAKWLSEKLNNLGITISKRLTIPDKKKDIKETIKLSIDESDIIIVTGGLGPTNDDITKKTLCETQSPQHSQFGTALGLQHGFGFGLGIRFEV